MWWQYRSVTRMPYILWVAGSTPAHAAESQSALDCGASAQRFSCEQHDTAGCVSLTNIGEYGRNGAEHVRGLGPAAHVGSGICHVYQPNRTERVSVRCFHCRPSATL